MTRGAGGGAGKKRLLVAGAGGFLGWHVCQAARRDWEVHGAVHTHPVRIPGVAAAPLDLTRHADVRRLFADLRPHAVIHTAAASDPNFCQVHPDISRAVNADASAFLARLCADAGVPFLFTSTDLVFDGRRPPYREDDPVSPVSVYGEHKAEAEKRILEAHPVACVCRLPLMFGLSGAGRPTFFETMVNHFGAGTPVRLFTDEIRTPIGVAVAASGLLFALNAVRGRIHLGGPSSISRYDFGLLTARLLERRRPSIVPCRRADVVMPAPRPRDVSLDSRRIMTYGFSPPALEDQITTAVHDPEKEIFA